LAQDRGPSIPNAIFSGSDVSFFIAPKGDEIAAIEALEKWKATLPPQDLSLFLIC